MASMHNGRYHGLQTYTLKKVGNFIEYGAASLQMPHRLNLITDQLSFTFMISQA